MPKAKVKTKRPNSRYAGPYGVSTADGKPSVHHYNLRRDRNEAALTENAIPSLIQDASAAPAAAEHPGSGTTRQAGTVCRADIEAVPGVAAATGNVASGSGQGSRLDELHPDKPWSSVVPKPKSSTATAAAPALAKPKLSLKKMPKAEADALAESEGKRRCNRCSVARNLECFRRLTVPYYGPLTDTHKSCNKCKLTSIRPVSRRPSLDEFGRQYLGERDEDEDEEGNAEEEGEKKEAEAMDVDGGNQGYETETSPEDYNPED